MTLEGRAPDGYASLPEHGQGALQSAYRIEGRFGKRIVYGGVLISLARALSFNGLNNAFHIAAINGGRHVALPFAGDTVYSWSKSLKRRSCWPVRTLARSERDRNFALRIGLE